MNYFNYFLYRKAKNEDTLMHILGTVPTENFGKALEKYIRYWITDTLLLLQLLRCYLSSCRVSCSCYLTESYIHVAVFGLSQLTDLKLDNIVLCCAV